MNKDQIFSIYNLSKFLCLLAYLFIALNSRADNGYWDFDSSDLVSCENWDVHYDCYGSITWPDGAKYDGHMAVDIDSGVKLPAGNGIIRWPDGTVLQGTFNPGGNGHYEDDFLVGVLNWPARIILPNGLIYDHNYDIAGTDIKVAYPFVGNKENNSKFKLMDKKLSNCCYPKKPEGKFKLISGNPKLPEKLYSGGGYDPDKINNSIDEKANSKNIVVAENEPLSSFKNLMDDMGKFVDYGKSLGYEFADIDIYYDAKSIKSIGDKKRVWFIKSGLDSSTKYFKVYAEFDCIDSITILDLTAFDSFSSANGSSVKTDGRKDYYEPESSFKNLAEEVCK